MAVIVTLKQNSTWLANSPSKRIMYPEWLKLGAMGFRKGIKVTLFHGKQLATIDRVVRGKNCFWGLRGPCLAITFKAVASGDYVR